MKNFVINISGLASNSEYSQYDKCSTPLARADIKNINELASKGTVGVIKVTDDENPSTTKCNLALLGYDVKNPTINIGPSSYEALSLNVNISANDLIFRTDFVSISGNTAEVEYLKMEPTGVNFLTKEEAGHLTYSLNEALADGILELYNGNGSRGCAIFRGARANDADGVIFGEMLTPPIKVMGKTLEDYLPQGKGADIFKSIFKRSLDLLRDHPVNRDRIYRKLLPANAIWLFGRATKPALKDFRDITGFNGTVISDSALVNGIAIAANLDNRYYKEHGEYAWNDEVAYTEKINFAINDIFRHDFFYIHYGSPNTYSHLNDEGGKQYAIEKIDEAIGLLVQKLNSLGEEYTISVVSDHVTSCKTGLNMKGIVPFFTYKSSNQKNNDIKFNESEAQKGIYLSDGTSFIKFLKMC